MRELNVTGKQSGEDPRETERWEKDKEKEKERRDELRDRGDGMRGGRDDPTEAPNVSPPAGTVI